MLVVGQGRVCGVVTDGKRNVPMEFVNVGIVGQPKGTTTDDAGAYCLELNGRDSVTLRFSFTGYDAVEHRVKAGMVVDVTLMPVAHQLDEVEIRDEKTRQSTFTQITVEKLDDAVGPASGVESLVKMLPDVQSNNELSSQYSVRGGSFDENLVYINGIEVFRPMLIRSAQQEGMSIINPDLVDHILFSPGGFDASYGDKLSSVLDITYGRPHEFGAKLSGSLLGATASVRGLLGDKFSYAAAFRQHSNRYVLGSLDTKGRYNTSYTDLQALVGYEPNDRLSLNLLTVWTRNVYGLVPDSATTTFGGFFMPLVLHVYFDGQEQDSYNTLLGAFSADYRPDDNWHLRGSLSAQHVPEIERYDVQSQYWLYELGMGESAGDTIMFDRGVGTFLEHARNRLTTDIFSLSFRADRQALLGVWNMGLNLQLERITDHLREWKWVDSAGYALPATFLPLGDSTNAPINPLLQHFANAENRLFTSHATAFLQREANLTTSHDAQLKLLAGIRAHLYTIHNQQPAHHFFLSPRLSAAYKPVAKQDILYRIATGIYQQAPFYREYRRDDGSLNTNVGPQTSYQIMATTDWRLRLWQRPFTITTDLYYKYITDLIPYTVDNLRLRYMPDLSAVAYAVGLSLRINGELIDGLESWASLSFMQTQEDIVGDSLGWLARPTDQRISFKLFLQDNIPSMPWWRMSLSLVFGTGTPVTVPMSHRTDETMRLPAYYRADWGNTVSLAEFPFYKRSTFWRTFKDVQLGVELFNVFNFRNVVSYLWVADYENHYYPVPNYLTARQLNFKLSILF